MSTRRASPVASLRAWFAAAALLVAACASAGPREHPATEAACQARGGEWTRIGMAQVAVCLMPATDAGKPCRDVRDCDGECIAPDGTPDGAQVDGRCSADTHPFGCKLRVVQGVARFLCLD